MCRVCAFAVNRNSYKRASDNVQYTDYRTESYTAYESYYDTEAYYDTENRTTYVTETYTETQPVTRTEQYEYPIEEPYYEPRSVQRTGYRSETRYHPAPTLTCAECQCADCVTPLKQTLSIRCECYACGCTAFESSAAKSVSASRRGVTLADMSMNPPSRPVDPSTSPHRLSGVAPIPQFACLSLYLWSLSAIGIRGIVLAQSSSTALFSVAFPQSVCAVLLSVSLPSAILTAVITVMLWRGADLDSDSLWSCFTYDQYPYGCCSQYGGCGDGSVWRYSRIRDESKRRCCTLPRCLCLTFMIALVPLFLALTCDNVWPSFVSAREIKPVCFWQSFNDTQTQPPTPTPTPTPPVETAYLTLWAGAYDSGVEIINNGSRLSRYVV